MTSCRLPSSGPDVEEGAVDEAAVDAAMAAARVLVGLSAQSVAAVDDVVTLPQLRVLVMIASQGSLNLAAVAAALGVHPSNATRAVERLVVAGLLDRGDDPADRRNVVLELTGAGSTLVDRVMEHRRAAIVKILDQMPVADRDALAAAMSSFVTAAGDLSADAVWSLGWTTTP